MSSFIHFSDSATIKNTINKFPGFNIPLRNYQEMGVTKVVADLAAERFADKRLFKTIVDLQRGLLIEDLKRGKDGFSDKPLPTFSSLTEYDWFFINIYLAEALEQYDVQRKL